ncbi:hypothetical protein I6I97_21535 [Sphingobacterium multivorum]|uniref:ABM domain-containing protein n=1 Tax=Sphingobacterium multivorum TaxID=28454 RepID=A0A654DRD7_SPHMU|nr:hypothetical protein [Sphingobacterium multivorum]QQT61734.1 hypothetical protein I6I97_21535 [Sphingobacterium multivorum]VXD05101.1 conserved hypothetical protein [Sphingobacterium multivorum]
MDNKNKEQMTTAYLQIVLKMNSSNRGELTSTYHKFKDLFREQIKGAKTQELLFSDEDIQLLYGFDTYEDAEAFLSTELYNNIILVALKPLISNNPEIKIYHVA